MGASDAAIADMQVDCQPPDPIEVAVSMYSMKNSQVALHFNKVAGSGNLQAVQIGHADQVIRPDLVWS